MVACRIGRFFLNSILVAQLYLVANKSMAKLHAAYCVVGGIANQKVNHVHQTLESEYKNKVSSDIRKQG